MALNQNIQIQQQARGFDMSTNAREAQLHPSVADGIISSGLASAATAPGSPAAVLGTGMNVDLYTPPLETV